MGPQTPLLQPVTNSKQLFVHGKPFLMRAAELQNSSLSSADYMRGIWPRLVGANINTVLGSVTGEQIEPEEGSFDFSEVTKIVQDAREHNLHLDGLRKTRSNFRVRSCAKKAGGGGQLGTYPSGGGVINVPDIRLSFAPSLAMISPDIYLNNYRATCEKYRHRSQPLFIPEQRRDEYGARRIWAAFGSFQALGTAPFGIDTLELDDNPFRKHYGLLAKVSHHAQRSLGTSIGFFFDELRPSGEDPSPPITVVFDSWKLQIERSFVFGKPGPGVGMVIHKGGARFFLIGEGFQVKFSSTSPKSVFTGILKSVEKEVVNEETGEMRSLRILGGDETRRGQAAVMPAENPDYGSFPISITIPANTRIAECEVYALEEEAVHLLN
ncbi:hypothetical protein FQN52_007757 [Onygenales sp. PD_12]|nr:hypothetical protein FQN52_007757 [Onygenales sp. PD_12]